jgi:glycosyltransferase involved in cell wall biosynthesis
MNENMRMCAVIPVYRHGKTLRAVVVQILQKKIPVIIVDDGNDAETKKYIADAKAEFPELEIVTLQKNQGKGGAVMSGMFRARELGYTHALQVDADGQHDLDCIGTFVDAAAASPLSMISGYPVYDEDVPSSRKNGRKITNFWIAIETLSRDIKDGMCGFRVYPLEKTCRILKRSFIGKRMTFDIEILVRLAWAGVRMTFKPIKVSYPQDGISNFRMVKDNIAISAMHTKLFFGMIVRSPVLIVCKVARHGN